MGAVVVGRSVCLACHRSIVVRALLAPNVFLDEPTFCGPCGRPRDTEAALFLTQAWLDLLVALRREAGPIAQNKGPRIRRRTAPWRRAGL